MIALINANRMTPPIAPVGLEYVASAAAWAGIDVRVLDLCMSSDPSADLRAFFASQRPGLVGVSFRNVDDSFWPSAQWFVPQLDELLAEIRNLTDSPIVLGGVGFSIFAAEIMSRSDADFGIRGDGERALVQLARELESPRPDLTRVGGLIWRREGEIVQNAPAWPAAITTAPRRDILDNKRYFALGGQIGIETKRGCDRGCIYCADFLAKGAAIRRRSPSAVADEAEALLNQGIDVLHLCDSEFNVPGEHARDVCAEFIRRQLGRRLRWYAYLAVTPFDAAIAADMKAAGCVGINFTGDSASQQMLTRYRQNHTIDDLAASVRHCRDNGIAVMVDLLLGGPGETPQTLAETISRLKAIGPDCVGAGVGMRLYPHTPAVRQLLCEGPLEKTPGLRRRYDGRVDLLRPTFYISPALGDGPAALVREHIGGDQRFFEPMDDVAATQTDHNYNHNTPLAQAIAAGARGAYWDILRRMR